jgi:hypothetical protein
MRYDNHAVGRHAFSRHKDSRLDERAGRCMVHVILRSYTRRKEYDSYSLFTLPDDLIVCSDIDTYVVYV